MCDGVLLEEKFRGVKYQAGKYVVLEEFSTDFMVYDVEQKRYVLTYDVDIGDTVRDMLEGRRDRAFYRFRGEYYLVDNDFNILQKFGDYQIVDDDGNTHDMITDSIIPALFIDQRVVEIDNMRVTPIYVFREKQLQVYDQDGHLLRVYNLDSAFGTRSIHAESSYKDRYVNLEFRNSNTYFDLYKCEFVDGTGQFREIEVVSDDFVVAKNTSDIVLHVYNRAYTPSKYYTILLPTKYLSLRSDTSAHGSFLFVCVRTTIEETEIFILHKDYDFVTSIRVNNSTHIDPQVLAHIYNERLVEHNLLESMNI